MSNLEPCPSCGDTKPCIMRKTLPNGMWVCIIECMEEAPAINFSVRGVGETQEEAYEMAVGFWNTRYKRTCKDIAGGAHDFTCSECGAELELAPMKPIGKHETHEYVKVAYCPSCGAEVLDD